MQVVLAALEQLHEEGGRACLEPVAAELHFGQRIEQAERVVNVFRIFGKVVAVVPFFQCLSGFGFVHSVGLGQKPDVFLQIAVEFVLCNAADVGKTVGQRNVHQVVQVAEHTDFAELRHTRQQGEAEVLVAALQYAVEGFQRVAVVGEQRFVADGLEHGFVVFVHQHHDVPSGFSSP